MSESWNDIFNGQFAKDKQEFKSVIIAKRYSGKTFYQLCVILEECKTGVLTTKEAATAIFKLLKQRDNEDICSNDRCKGCEKFGWVCDYKSEMHGYFTCSLQNKKVADTHIIAELITPTHFLESEIVFRKDDE